MVKIEKLPKYLSPSSISTAKSMPNTFYMQRLVLDPIEREPQNLAMGVGTAFDIEIKRILIDKGVPTFNPIDTIEKSLQEESIREESFYAAGLLLDSYFGSRLRVTTNWTQVEGDFHQEYSFPYHYSNGQSVMKTVPLMCKLDAVVFDEEYKMDVPLDWKCSGYTSVSGVSPKPSFMQKWDGTKWCGSHKNYYPTMPVIELGVDWARQFTLYGMCLNKLKGLPDFTEFPVIVHHPIFNGKDKKPMIAVYRAICTPDFQKAVWREAVDLWEDLHSGTFVDRLVVKEGKFAVSAIASFANECESFFSFGGGKSAHQLWLENR